MSKRSSAGCRIFTSHRVTCQLLAFLLALEQTRLQALSKQCYRRAIPEAQPVSKLPWRELYFATADSGHFSHTVFIIDRRTGQFGHFTDSRLEWKRHLVIQVRNKLLAFLDEFGRSVQVTCYENPISRRLLKRTQLEELKESVQDYALANHLDKSVYLTGGSDTQGKASAKTHRFDIGPGTWRRLPDLKQARHHHSSCTVEKAVFVFCGHAEGEAGDLSSIERLQVGGTRLFYAWDLLRVKGLSPRQFTLVSPVSATEILIYGGFLKRELSDAFIFNTKTHTVKKQNLTGAIPCVCWCPSIMLRPGTAFSLVCDNQQVLH